MGRRRQLSFAFVAIHRWHGDTERVHNINEREQRGKSDRVGYPAVYDYTFAHIVWRRQRRPRGKQNANGSRALALARCKQINLEL